MRSSYFVTPAKTFPSAKKRSIYGSICTCSHLLSKDSQFPHVRDIRSHERQETQTVSSAPSSSRTLSRVCLGDGSPFFSHYFSLFLFYFSVIFHFFFPLVKMEKYEFSTKKNKYFQTFDCVHWSNFANLFCRHSSLIFSCFSSEIPSARLLTEHELFIDFFG